MRENKDVGTPRHMMIVAFFGLVWFLRCVCCVSCITVEQLMWHCGVGVALTNLAKRLNGTKGDKICSINSFFLPLFKGGKSK